MARSKSTQKRNGQLTHLAMTTKKRQSWTSRTAFKFSRKCEIRSQSIKENKVHLITEPEMRGINSSRGNLTRYISILALKVVLQLLLYMLLVSVAIMTRFSCYVRIMIQDVAHSLHKTIRKNKQVFSNTILHQEIGAGVDTYLFKCCKVIGAESFN